MSGVFEIVITESFSIFLEPGCLIYMYFIIVGESNNSKTTLSVLLNLYNFPTCNDLFVVIFTRLFFRACPTFTTCSLFIVVSNMFEILAKLHSKSAASREGKKGRGIKYRDDIFLLSRVLAKRLLLYSILCDDNVFIFFPNSGQRWLHLYGKCIR